MRARQFRPGFRLSFFDVIILLIGTIASYVMALQIWWSGAVISFAVFHFFLFCNVFRIRRKPELIWASVFVVLAGLTIFTEFSGGWWITFVVSVGVTVFLLRSEIGKPYYHGVLWKRWNPDLPEWWEKNVKTQAR